MAKKPRKKKQPIRQHGLGATKERQRQNGGVISEPIYERNDGVVHTRRHRARREHVLDGLRWHKRIEPFEHEAGMKFCKNYQRAVFRIRVDDGGSGSHGDREMAALGPIASEEILKKAYAILTPNERAIIIHVCGHGWLPGTTRKMETLRRGLLALAKHWGIPIIKIT